MTVKIKKNLVSPSKYAIKCPYPMVEEYITIHNTAMDAPASNEINYMIGNNSATGYHFAVDDKEVIQGLPLDRNGFACGDGKYGNGNRKSISVEICYSRSGGEKYKKAEALTIKLVAQLLHERKWSTDRVKPHQFWSGKYCPHRIFDNKEWNSIISRINAELQVLNGKKAVTPVSAPVSERGYLLKGDKGKRVEYLQTLLVKLGYKIAVDGSYGSATEAAVRAVQKDNRIKVDGSAGQQTFQVLEALTAPKNTAKNYMENGDSGANVKTLQTQLKQLGYKIDVDSHFGDATEAVVKKFQSDRKLAVDGYAGQATQTELKKAVAEKVAKDKKAAEAAKKVDTAPEHYGVVTVKTAHLNVRSRADFKSDIVKTIKKGTSWKAYFQKNGLYNIGGNQYISASPDLVSFKKNPLHGKPRTLVVTAKNLYTYNTPNWKDKGALVKQGEVFTITKELIVEGSKMYQIKSGLYITANESHIKLR